MQNRSLSRRTFLAGSAGAAAALRVVDDPLSRWSAGAPLPDGAGARARLLDWPARDRASVALDGRQSGPAREWLERLPGVARLLLPGPRQLP